MAQLINRLDSLKIKRALEPGYYADGAGLYLQVSTGGARSWIYRFMLAGRTRDMGLGSLLTISLAEARQAALEARKLHAAGIDPIEARKAQRVQKRAKDVRIVTFREEAEAYIEAHRSGWKNAKHAEQWRTTLEAYVYAQQMGRPRLFCLINGYDTLRALKAYGKCDLSHSGQSEQA
jgi:hypothetical protein